MFVQGVRDLQPADECQCRDILTAVEALDELALKKSMYDLRLSLCLILTERM